MFTYVQDAKKTSTIGRKKKLHKYLKGLRQPSWDNNLENSSSLLFLTSENYHETQRYNFSSFHFQSSSHYETSRHEGDLYALLKTGKSPLNDKPADKTPSFTSYQLISSACKLTKAFLVVSVLSFTPNPLSCVV